MPSRCPEAALAARARIDANPAELREAAREPWDAQALVLAEVLGAPAAPVAPAATNG